jgi:sterol desaturase/sphingolipid hydroxylase (fatty acid hydroxylase superfamily)
MPPAWLVPVLIAGVMASMVAAERIWPASQARPEWGANALAYVLTMAGQLVRGTLPAVATAAAIAHFGGGLIDLAQWPFWAGATAWLITMDLGEYLFHRAQHSIPFLWAMHSLHHSDRGLNFLTAQRHFWLEPAIKSVTVWLVPALLLRPTPAILALYVVISLYHFVVHANLRLGFGPLSWALNAPRYHRLHHSRDPAHYNTNFASLLPIFDVLSGAYRAPRAGEYPATGLEEAVQRHWELIVWPVRRWIPFRRASVKAT